MLHAFIISSIWMAMVIHSPSIDTLPGKKISADTTLSGQWFLQPVLASDVSTGKVPSINFDLQKKSFSGNTGCNSMKGVFTLHGSDLIFNDRIITTKMACEGYNESAFLKNLLRTNQYKFSKGVLILMVDGTELSRWTRQIKKAKKTDTA